MEKEEILVIAETSQAQIVQQDISKQNQPQETNSQDVSIQEKIDIVPETVTTPVAS
jgi:hypothetical protein